MRFPRASGILLHPTSLPGGDGIGDLGDEALRFVDFLVRAKQTYWQTLPLNPTGWGDSPYGSFSAFAGNTLLISDCGLGNADSQYPRSQVRTDASSKSAIRDPHSAIDYGAVFESKSLMLRAAFEDFQKSNTELKDEFETFVHDNASWLDDYALYRAIKASQGQRPWYEWDDELKRRDEHALSEATRTLRDDVLAEKFYQFLFFRQWYAVKEYANTNGVKIVGDVPIFLALDSADVWLHQELFKLNSDGSPTVVSGVPPDYFSKTGQLWGNPIYNWDAMREDGFAWWIERIRHTLKMFDVARIDHFLGFAAAWEVPGGDPTAEHGEWIAAPGRELFSAMKDELGELPFWVEDLGVVTPEVESLRDEFEFPGMRILQFAFGGDARDLALPHNHVRNSIAYTGTHDNDTTVGWWNSLPTDSDARRFCMKYLDTDGSEIHWDMIRAAWAAVADTAVAPLQDVLGFGGEARMNTPATTSGNWQWRFNKDDLNDEIADRLAEMTEIYGRA